MAEYNVSRVDYNLKIDSKYYNNLDIVGFSRMMKDPSFCYKFYWLEAIVKLISEGIQDTTFDEIIDEMIYNAWYSVREYHVHLSGMPMDGKIKDGLERAVVKLAELSDLESTASRLDIKNTIKQFNKELKKEKEQLTNMVPYRALAGFFPDTLTDADWGIGRITAYIERVNRESVVLPYTLGTESLLKKTVHFNPFWIEMIRDNTVEILGWIQFEKLKWLQNNNPEVPGLVYKLTSNGAGEKLDKARKLWRAVMDIQPIFNVFNSTQVDPSDYDVDHFIPHSFVMNDELWNLMPMDSGLNSSKNNRLPNWKYFGRFAQNQFALYKIIHEKDTIHKLFENCFKDNLHSIWAIQELYQAGNDEKRFHTILQKNMRPIYDSAKRQGYEIWNEKDAIDRLYASPMH